VHSMHHKRQPIGLQSWLPVGITAYGGMHLVRKAHPTALTAERHLLHDMLLIALCAIISSAVTGYRK
jgi:hypothetical protein